MTWRIAVVSLALVMSIGAGVSAAQTPSVETIVLVRHGEKPDLGLGQLDCQGLNRALALPGVIAKDFGHPTAIFAPDPSEQTTDHGVAYDYVRPLATIEPTAIAFGLPVDASIGMSHIDDLQAKLESAPYRGGFVLVGWEHSLLVKLVRNLMAAHGGDPASVPDWKNSDFDGIYVVKIAWSGDSGTATFERGQEGLNGMPTACPGANP